MTGKLRVAVAALTALALSGCGFTGLYGTALPGAKAGKGGFQVTAIFDDALDLVPQSAVKVADVTVGTVRKVALTSDHKAEVTMGLESGTKLPANAVAIIEQTSLLGEKFVELATPTAVPPEGRLSDGARIDATRTTTYPDLEQVFGALSLVLNGGSLERIQTISYELARAMAGREGKVRDLLTQLDTFVGGLDRNKSDVIRAIEALDRLSVTLARQRTTINRALTDLSPGLKILSENRANLTRMLTALSDLGKVGTRVINASAANTAADLRNLKPVLQRVQAAGKSLPRSLELLLDYPFPRSSVAGVPGDYTSLYVTVLIDNSLCNPVPIPGCPIVGTPGATGGNSTTPGKVPAAPGTKPSVPSPGPTSGGLLPLPVPLPTEVGSPLSGLGFLIGGALR
ncbi:MAG: phospholipid/cholesterol/gamma-HCH transport system substrate-binding protein [Frankiales bacterium]|nr:phospholipid/cholesterol/gamma-HCH transport system substrate-binding protein [Frankiales bacterium]